MSRVDFYVLAGTGEPSRHRFACRLAEKAYRLNNTVHIHTASQQQAELLDELLWTFRDGSFVPHELLGVAGRHTNAPVTIGFDEAGIGGQDLLQSRQQSRKRFVRYRELGAELETHKL